MAMRIGNYAGIGSGYQNSNTGRSDKICDVRSYSKYLMGKYACLTPGKNASVSVTGGMVRKAMSDEKPQIGSKENCLRRRITSKKPNGQRLLADPL